MSIHTENLQSLLEEWVERAAIREFDGNQVRNDAELGAAADLCRRYDMPETMAPALMASLRSADRLDQLLFPDLLDCCDCCGQRKCHIPCPNCRCTSGDGQDAA